VKQVCTGFAPSPFALPMLDELVPTVERIEGAARSLAASDTTRGLFE
jgi:hypothetical protein